MANRPIRNRCTSSIAHFEWLYGRVTGHRLGDREVFEVKLCITLFSYRGFPKPAHVPAFFLEIFWEYLTQTSFENLALGRKKALKACSLIFAWNSRISISFANKNNRLNRNYSATYLAYMVVNRFTKLKLFFRKISPCAYFFYKFFFHKCRFLKISTGSI